MIKRRVSFAPDAELTQVQTFHKEVRCASVALKVRAHLRQDDQTVDSKGAKPETPLLDTPAEPINPNNHFALAPQPACTSPTSPTQPANMTVTMDLTNTTDALPTASGSATWQLQQYAQAQGAPMPLEDTTMGMEVTAGVPDLHDLLQEDVTAGTAPGVWCTVLQVCTTCMHRGGRPGRGATAQQVGVCAGSRADDAH